MCWWHMATHWQLGVQVQEQTWVLKSQLAEAKFSACALGAREPGKCWASITPQTALPSCRFQACLPGATAATQQSGEQGKDTRGYTSTSHAQLPAGKYSEQPKHRLLVTWNFLLQSSLQGALSLPLWPDAQQGRAIRNPVLPALKVHHMKPLQKTRYDIKVTFT